MSIKLYMKFIKTSLSEFFIYRSTAILTSIIGFLFFSIEILAGIVYFEFSDNILGYSRNDYLLIIIFANLITNLYNLFFVVAHENLAETIIEGELDYTLIRPVNSFYYYALNRLDISSIINIAINLIALKYIISYYTISPLQNLYIIIFLLLGVLLQFVLNQFFVELTFWKERATSIMAIPEYLFDFSIRPKSFYPYIIRLLLTFVIPVLVATNGPIMILKGENIILETIILAAFVIIGFIICQIMWKKGLKKYTSSN